MFGERWQVLRSSALALCVLAWGAVMIGGCSEQSRYQVLSFFFEGVPSPGATPEPEQLAMHHPRRPPAPRATPTPKPIVIEAREQLSGDWLEQLLKGLPHDAAGYPDMVAAFDTLKPRPGPGKNPAIKDVLDNDIKMIPDGKLKCIFSHKVHTSWLSCSSCHPRLFQEKTGEEIAMSDFNSGKFCGACHGKVAFPVKGECVRCHSGMKKKEAKKPPEEKLVKSEITLARKDSNDPMVKEIPPAIFPHLQHRVRFRCYACHDQVFEMKKGAKSITMQEIDEGKFCGTCHNGRDAFAESFSTCSKCHRGA